VPLNPAAPQYFKILQNHAVAEKNADFAKGKWRRLADKAFFRRLRLAAESGTSPLTRTKQK